MPSSGFAQQQGEWQTLLDLGGPVVLILLAMSVVALTVSLYKMLQLRHYSGRVLNSIDKAVNRWCEGDTEQAIQMLDASTSPLAAPISKAMHWLPGTASQRDTIEAELSRIAQRLLAGLAARLGILEQIAYLAPLLGLLGTVLGIIDVFQGLAEQGSGADAGSLAGGIWEALLTTAVGLCVAIPFALLHAAFQGRIDTLRLFLQDQLTRMLTAPIYREGQAREQE